MLTAGFMWLLIKSHLKWPAPTLLSETKQHDLHECKSDYD
jgi:hypothetical protein